ncbi:FecCD family ABC transporter permease [Blastococcus saxobsidens]|uniref:Iron ABC transporter permease protein n=1 Tax=Blastococcus saxobsidens (strain DD2) TaxID=1146883 RepID=H6RU97_BLASD|nr:iron ABC transporter permease [Blastococcus saxobsidens]CCG05704.1 Iron ABC transporter permease protein [Blastococcus saxobsidens DD2]
MSTGTTLRRRAGPSRLRTVRRIRPVRISVRYRPRVVITGLLLALLAAGLMVWTMTLGEIRIAPAEVLATSLGFGSGEHDFVVLTLRLPRTLAAFGVGVALAVSGAIFQSLVRNPLVAPDIIGVMAGAGLAAVVLIVLFGTPAVVPVGAFLGALAATALLYGLTWRGGVAGHRLVLVGIAIHALLTALTTLILVRFPIELVSSAVLWLTGTLYASTWQQVGWLATGLLVLLPAALALTPRLQVLELGDDSAAALGIRTQPARAAALLVAASLAAVGVAAAGPVGFVALMVPHAARMLLGPLTGGVLAATGLLGAVLVLASDLIAQHAFSPVSLPVGVVTAAVGAPYFLFLLWRTNRGVS